MHAPQKVIEISHKASIRHIIRKTSKLMKTFIEIKLLRPNFVALPALSNHLTMKLQLSFFSLFLAFTLVLSFTVLTKKAMKKSNIENQNSKLPPGPKKLPIIGNLHQLLGLPHHSLRDLAKKHGPLMHLKLGEVSAIVVSSSKVAKKIMNTHDLIFADRGEVLAGKIITYNYSDVAFAPYGDYWRYMRKIFALEVLSAKNVLSFRSLREEEVSNLIKHISLKTGSEINLTEKIFSLTSDITTRAAFGQKCKDKEIFLSSMKEALQMGGGFDIADIFPSKKFLHVISGLKPRLEKLHHKIDRVLDEILKDHRGNLTRTKDSTGDLEEDLVDVLIRIQESSELEFPITTNNLKAVILDIFSGGTETSSSTIEWAMAEMLKDPRVMKKAQTEVRQVLNRNGRVDENEVKELSYIKLVIKETLRLHPPLPLLLPRQSREKCEIDGYIIPINTKVIVNAWAIERDPEYWSDPESFKPERFENSSNDYKGTNLEYIPFGAGRRICPGIDFAVANMELVLAQLLYHFDWKLPDGIKPEDLDMSETFGMTVTRKNNLNLIPILYGPLLAE